MEKELEKNLIEDNQMKTYSQEEVFGIISAFTKRYQKHKEQKRLKIEATKYLDATFFEEYLTLTINGYIPNKKQKEIWQEHLDSLIKKNDLSTLNKYIEKGLKFDFFTKLYLSNKFFDYFHQELKKLPDFNSNYGFIKFEENNTILNLCRREYLSDDFKKVLQDTWFSNLKYTYKEFKRAYTGDSIDRLFAPFTLSQDIYRDLCVHLVETPEIILNNLDYDKYMKSLSDWTYIIERTSFSDDFRKTISTKDYKVLTAPNFLSSMTDIIKKSHEELKNKKAQEINNDVKKVYIQMNIENHIQNIDIPTASIEELPTEANTILRNIEDIYNKIFQQKELNPEIKAQLNLLIQERIPYTVHKYLIIDEEFRKKSNIDNIFIKTLTDFEDILKTHLENINENNAKDLQVMSRYASTLKSNV